MPPQCSAIFHYDLNNTNETMGWLTSYKLRKLNSILLSNREMSLMNTGFFETGLSDHHLLMLKTPYDKLPPVKINYCKYKNFNRNSFFRDLRNMLCNYCINNYNDFLSNRYNLIKQICTYENEISPSK